MGFTISVLGTFKEKINTALYKNEDLKELLFSGKGQGEFKLSELEKFKKYVQSHLFIDETIKETGSYIFYDVIIKDIGYTTQNVSVIVMAVCHRSILDKMDDINPDLGYRGNRADIMAEMIEDTLVNNEEVSRDFGIGKIELKKIEIYNMPHMYGHILTFTVPDFSQENYR